jgi:Transposase DDE domain
MIDRVEGRFDLKPKRLIGDTAYGSAAMLGWLVDEKQIEPRIPVWDKSERDDGTFGRSDFTFDAATNRYTCPAGKTLKPSWRNKKKNPYRYSASQFDCQVGPLKTTCCPNVLSRKIVRSPFELARDVARALGKTDRYRQSRRDRKKVEVLFAHRKRILRADRLRLRGRTGARDEFLLTAIAQNLRRLAITFGSMPKETVPTPV